MPTSKELVANRPLSGDELSRIIQSDLRAMLEADCFCQQHVAYGRVAYDIRLTLHFDNPATPRSKNAVSSHSRTAAEVTASPALAAIETLPLSFPRSPDATLISTERHRRIDSPNMARIEHGLPIQVIHREQSGQTLVSEVLYPPDIVQGETIPPIDRDVTAEEGDRLGLNQPEMSDVFGA